jgi:hypothetical protein
VECSRQLLLHYRRRFERNLNGLIMAITDVYTLRAPPVTEKKDARERARQLLSKIHSAEDTSLKIYERTRMTYLSPLAE